MKRSILIVISVIFCLISCNKEPLHNEELGISLMTQSDASTLEDQIQTVNLRRSSVLDLGDGFEAFLKTYIKDLTNHNAPELLDVQGHLSVLKKAADKTGYPIDEQSLIGLQHQTVEPNQDFQKALKYISESITQHGFGYKLISLLDDYEEEMKTEFKNGRINQGAYEGIHSMISLSQSIAENTSLQTFFTEAGIGGMAPLGFFIFRPCFGLAVLAAILVAGCVAALATSTVGAIIPCAAAAAALAELGDCNGSNPCSGSLDPCCGSNDPCCLNPSDPCCDSNDPCCGDPDPCCGQGPCCGSNDPCCGNTNPCCGIVCPKGQICVHGQCLEL